MDFLGRALHIYIALVLPDGNFLTIGSPLTISDVGQVIPFAKSVSFTSEPMNIVDITFPELLLGLISFTQSLSMKMKTCLTKNTGRIPRPLTGPFNKFRNNLL